MDGLRQRAAKLAAAAARLKSAGGPRATAAPFHLAFLTDAARGMDPLLIARTLPAGAALVFRDYADPRRAAKARALRHVCARRGALFFLAGDPTLASDVEADGVHLRADQLARFTPAPRCLVSAACHTVADLNAAAALGADIAFLGPVFPTQSHPGAPTLGPASFCAMAAGAALPVLALGGVDETNTTLLQGRNVAGFGAIGAFAARAGGAQKKGQARRPAPARYPL